MDNIYYIYNGFMKKIVWVEVAIADFTGYFMK